MTNVYPESPLGSPVTAAPGTAPGGGAQEAATPGQAADVPQSPGEAAAEAQRALLAALDSAGAENASLREQLRQAEAGRDAAREAEQATSAQRERHLIALRNIARILATAHEKLTPVETVELIDAEVDGLDLSAALAERDAAREELAELALIHAARGDLLRDAVAERDRCRAALGSAYAVLAEHDEPDDDARSRAIAIIERALAGDGA